MEMKPVNSSNISQIGHDPELELLKVQFTKGAAYEYRDVTAETFGELESAPSVGSYFAQNIKGKYPYRKATG